MMIPLLNLENPDFGGLLDQAWAMVGEESGADFESFKLGFTTALGSMLGSLAFPVA